jgi:hypothetical protein
LCKLFSFVLMIIIEQCHQSRCSNVYIKYYLDVYAQVGNYFHLCMYCHALCSETYSFLCSYIQYTTMSKSLETPNENIFPLLFQEMLLFLIMNLVLIDVSNIIFYLFVYCKHIYNQRLPRSVLTAGCQQGWGRGYHPPAMLFRV